jgi:hypothetical protein
VDETKFWKLRHRRRIDMNMFASIFYSIIAILVFLILAYKHGLETGTCKNCSFPYRDHFHIMGKGMNRNLVDKAWAECPNPYLLENSYRGELSRKLKALENSSEECPRCSGTGKVTNGPQTFVPFTLADKVSDFLRFLS